MKNKRKAVGNEIGVLLSVLMICMVFLLGGCAESEVTLYVATDGSDAGSGTKDAPFATLKRAFEEIGTLAAAGNKNDVAVRVSGGEYRVESMDITPEAGNYPFHVSVTGDGAEKTVLSGGVSLDSADFKEVDDEKITLRLSEEQKAHIRCLDLSGYGLTAEKIGGLYGFGTWSTGSRYENGAGNNADIFRNGERMTLARYPNDDFVRIVQVLDEGEQGADSPLGGTVTLQEKVIERMKTWAEPEKAWAYGYFCWDWADSSSPLASFDPEKLSVTFGFTSSYGYKEGQYFYFYNILEELDTDGEYYIDRDEMKLYCWFAGDAEQSDYMLTVLTEPIISGTVSDVSFEGLGFKGMRGDIITLIGNNITFRDCRFSESYGNALSITGSDNLVYGCEVSHMGRGGIFLTGGDRETLTPGNNVIENCDIHDFGEVYRTYQVGASISGVGNRIIHNELYNTPHMAITFGGNDNLIENNYIHNVSYEVDDGGALYVGRNWTTYGNVIKNNLFENIVGVNGHKPEAIYLDDSISGISVIGNIVRNCDGIGLELGGGHDLDVRNNIFINCDVALHYDNRTCKGQWMDATVKTGSVATLYASIEAVPFTGERWLEKYPVIAQISLDPEDWSQPSYIGNPSRSVVKNNIYYDCWTCEEICDEAYLYSDIQYQTNILAVEADMNPDGYTVTEKFITKNGLEGFESPDVSQIGKYAESGEEQK